MNKQNDELMHIALVVTNAGKEAERQALLAGKKIKLTHVIVDSVLLPEAADPKKLTAVQQCPRDQNGDLAKYFVGGESKNDQLLIAWSLPVESGNYMINGLGFALEDGTLYAYQRVVIGYKPNPNTGALFEPRGIALQEISDKSAITFNLHLDDIYATLEDLSFLISQIQYATTTEKGLIELATPQEVVAGSDGIRAVTPATLKPVIDNTKRFASDIATQEANRVKSEIYGGVPTLTLDTIKEVSDALLVSGDAIATLFEKLAQLESRDNVIIQNMRKVEGKLGRVRLYMQNDVDADYLAIRGQTIKKEDYPDYFAHLNITTPTLKLPDWSTHGYIRQFSDSLTAGATLEQEILSHAHTATIGNNGGHTPIAMPIDLGSKNGTFSISESFDTTGNGSISASLPIDMRNGDDGTRPARINGTTWGGNASTVPIGIPFNYNQSVRVSFSDVPVSTHIGTFTPTLHPVTPHSHIAHISMTGGSENRPKTTIAVYAVKVKFITII